MEVKEIKKLTEMIISGMNKSQPDQTTKMVNNIPDSTKPVPNNAKKSLFNGVGSLLKTAAPIAASFIPGVGPIASQLLSTLNDDSWFEEYKSAGAAFNEKLVTKITNQGTKANVKLLVNPRAAIATIHTRPNFYSTGVQKEVGASMLAYIRKQTNNVLADDTDLYFKVIDAYMHLYAIHFTLAKWLKFAQKQPINIPMPSEVVQIIKPQHLNLLMGIAESLKQYLQATVKLPYPLVEAMRWRFGTLFHSFNTGQPGFVSYDRVSPVATVSAQDKGAMLLEWISNDIKTYQNIIAEAGRAGGDVTLAYTNQINRLDVEDAHYDEKEFNLRHNIMFQDASYPLVELIPIIKDSRLATSPAIQASLLSLSLPDDENDLTLFTCYRERPDSDNMATWLAYYVDSTIPYTDNPHNNAALAGIPTKAGWYLDEFLPGQHLTSRSLSFRIDNATGPGALTLSDSMKTDGRATLSYNNSNLFTIALQRSLGFYKTPSSQSTMVFENGTGNNYAQLILSVDQISYDLALVSPETVRAIQSAALRNLTRGNMPGPKPDVTVADVKPAITEIAKSIDTIKN